VTNETIDELKSQLGIGFLETSAKTRLNVEEAFYELVRLIRTYQMKKCTPLNVSTKEKKRKVTCNML